MKKITVLDIKFYPHTVRWYRRKKSKQDSTQVSCFDGFAHVETVDGMRTAHVRVICDPMEKPDKICTVHMARAYDVGQLSAQDVQMEAYECVLQEMQQYIRNAGVFFKNDRRKTLSLGNGFQRQAPADNQARRPCTSGAGLVCDLR